MTKHSRNDDQLRKASEHLYYEVKMFLTLARALGTGVFGESYLNNAALEAFTVHARVLIKFFFDENPQKDDIVASDFLGLGTAQSIFGDRVHILKTARERINKEVVHLTYTRLNVLPENKPWQFMELAEAIEELTNKFIKAVHKDKLADDWKQLVSVTPERQ